MRSLNTAIVTRLATAITNTPELFYFRFLLLHCNNNRMCRPIR